MSDAEQLRQGLKQSAQNRAAVIQKFGFIPRSVLRLSRGGLTKKMFVFQNERPDRSRNFERAGRNDTGSPASASERRKIGIIGGGLTPIQNSLQASAMPAELVDFFVKFYSRPGDVYLDPFMGQGIQMQVAKLRGLDYYGYDLSEDFFQYIDAIRGKIDDGRTVIKTTHGDSRFPDEIPDGIGDFCFTSPPYWDIEFYGNEPEQLGTGKTYGEFLDGMQDVAAAWLPKFKTGAYACINVGDFRRSKRYYCYVADTIRIFTAAGWIMYDMWIIDGLVGGLSQMFSVKRAINRLSTKSHEYCVIFRKGDGTDAGTDEDDGNRQGADG